METIMTKLGKHLYGNNKLLRNIGLGMVYAFGLFVVALQLRSLIP